MTQDILAYMNVNDQSLADFSHRFQILADEGLVCADDIHHAIDLISLRHIVKCRSYYGNVSSIKIQLISTFGDLETLEHFEAGHLTLENAHLSVLSKNLLDAQKEMRAVGNELVSKLTNGSARSDVKNVRKRLESCKSQRDVHLNAFADAISDKVVYESMGPWVGSLYGMPTLLFGYWENEARRRSDVAWRDNLSDKKLAKFRKALSRKPIPIMGRRTREQITFMSLEDEFAPVFRVDLRGAETIEGYVPWQAMSTLYVALYRRWSKFHLKYENKLFYDDYKVDLTLFRKRLNVALPPSFLSPRQLMHDLVAHIMENVN